MNLYDILACPVCKGALIRQDIALLCSHCQRTYPIINNVPVLLPDGSVPVTQHQHALQMRSGYDPWIHRVILQSLPFNAPILEIGAGNMSFNVPHIIRMDVTLTPYVDVVGDVHALPFLPQTFAFVFSLAVIEHLRQPFVAAQEMYDVLCNGGYVYGECNFVFPYHAYPHHYFNMTQQGLEEIFKPFTRLRSGIAPYQMPSFAIRALLDTCLDILGPGDHPGLQQLQELFQQILDQPAALRCAAGVYFAGVKPPQLMSEAIPDLVQSMYTQTPELQQRFPSMLDLSTANNIMIWAQTEGRQCSEALAEYFDTLVPFCKNGVAGEQNRTALRDAGVVEPIFGHIPEPSRQRSVLLYSKRSLRRWMGRMKRICSASACAINKRSKV
jgi:uncharacterized protein YbaR (Trm112 family)/SAM-dependent methyltransferase